MLEKTIVIKQNLTLDKVIKKLRQNYVFPTYFRLFLEEYLSTEIGKNVTHNCEPKKVSHVIKLWTGDIKTRDDLELIWLWRRFWGDFNTANYFFLKSIKTFLKTRKNYDPHSENISQLSPPSKSI